MGHRPLSLQPDEVQALVALARDVERHYGCAQDLEWAIDRSDVLYLLQSRAETVWSQRPKTLQPVTATPVAAIAATFLRSAGKR